MDKYITVKGIKTHNLKNIDVRIPGAKITAIVGVSGAGKTSLAFDTIYAEGYTRYIESISPYTRQFLDKMEKPPVDTIDGLPPAIAFRHKKPAKNPRSIVATAMDIFDYLRILYAKIADFYCPSCGKEIRKYTIDEIAAQLMDSYEGTVTVTFPYKGDIAFLINRGYYFHIREGTKKRIDNTVKNKTIDVQIDKVEIKEKNKSRLFEALDRSIAFGKGTVAIYYEGKKELFPSNLYCSTCDTSYSPPDEHLFSFNTPKGACPACKGFGDIQSLDRRRLFDYSLSLWDGGIIPFNTPTTRYYRDFILQQADAVGIDIYAPVKNLSETELNYLVEGNEYFEGIKGFFDQLKKKSYKVQARVFLSRYTTYEKCRSCGGSRLNDVALAFKVKGKTIADFLAFTVIEARDFMQQLNEADYGHKISPEVLQEIRRRLDYLVESGLSYIGLNRHTFTLSRGEFQRINLAFILGSSLSDSLLIIDQPSSDLHPRDYEKLLKHLDGLKKNKNTVLLIEHNREIVRHCDYVLELGPLSGEKGGQLIFSGSKEEFFRTAGFGQAQGPAPTGDANVLVGAGPRACPTIEAGRNTTLTQKLFNMPLTVGETGKTFKTWYSFTNASTHNLKNFDFKIPANAFTVITGVSGAGKTTLLYEEMYLKTGSPAGKGDKKNIKEVIFIDPGLDNLRKTSIMAGYFEVYKAIRELFSQLKESRLQGYTPGHFSFNSAHGRCAECGGKGYLEIEMQFLSPVQIQCHQCAGKGFKPEVLKIQYKGRNIREILDLSVNRFIETAGEDLPAKERGILTNICENGLGYIKLGQPLKTLSTGELQRIKLIKYLNMKKSRTLFLIDEPSFGLHDYDIEMVKKLIATIIANKNTVAAAEHNMRLIAFADYLLELGPGGGKAGGRLIFQGTPGAAATASGSITGNYLKKN